jgi:tetratricopeptide (TPR) repeat protein
MKKLLLLLFVLFLCAVNLMIAKASPDENEIFEKMLLKGYKKHQSGNLKAAEKMYTEALLLNTTSPEIYFRRGRTRYALGKLEEALSDFQKAIDFNPSYSEAYNHKGIVHLDAGDTASALQNHTKAIELNPHYADAYYQRAFVNMHQKNYKEAIDDYNMAIERNTAEGYMYLNRGYAYYLNGDYEKALLDTHKAAMMMPENPYVFKIKAITEIALKNSEAACESISRALDLGYTDAYGDDLEKLARKICK